MTATVRAIRVYPVKGAPPLDLESVQIDVEGLDGDRRKGAPVHLVSAQAIARTGERPPRANLVIDLGADVPDGLEREWVGREVGVGPARLRVTQTPKHCLGVYAEVLRPGRVNVGDPVDLRG